MQQLNDLDFLRFLEQRGIELRANKDRLRVNAPAGALNKLVQEELLRRKNRLLALLDDQSPLAANGQIKTAPLSYAQQNIWLVERFHPGMAAYNIPQAFLLNAPVDLVILQEAVDRVVARQGSLRTYIGKTTGEEMQHIVHKVDVPVAFTDLSAFDSGESERRLLERMRQESQRPFNLSQPPLIRFELFRLEPSRHVLFVNVHHLLADLWSVDILKRELDAHYIAIATGSTEELPPLPIQYSDYALWEREHDRPEQQAQLEYWKAKLAHAPAYLELPFSKPRPAMQSFAGEVEPCPISQNVMDPLRQLARSENASLYILLLAAFSVLLYRYTGKEDFCIGSPISGRRRVETEPLIGLFINTIVMRCQPRPAVSFRQLLRHVRDTALEAYANSDVPFQKLVMELHPERDPGSSPIFQVMFTLDAIPPDGPDGPSRMDPQAGTAKFDLTLQLADSGQAIEGGIEYRTDLFDQASMRQLAASLSVLLQEIARHPDQSIATLDLLPPAERQRILVDWNATELDFPRDSAIHRLFEQQAEKTPDAVAVIFGTEEITYRDLNRRANRLAHHLIGRGVRPEVCVGICLHRSIDMIAAMLAILKAGGAYVPLDPAYPAARLVYMMEDSGLLTVVSEKALLPLLGARETQAIALDRDAQDIAAGAEHNPNLLVGPANLAYVIYTSGSTGRPKGVAIEHHSVVSLLHWGRETFSPEALRFMLASTSISFDISVFEIFLPLSFGHAIVLAEDALALPHLPSAARITFLNTVPTTMGALIGSNALPPSVQCVNLAGEPFPSSLVEQIQTVLPSAEIVDSYGPTETTVYSTSNRRHRGEPATIGRPLANTQIYILDANLQAVPPGIPGQIYIGGEGVARGYLGQPELTADRFLTLDHLPQPNRVYRTGDLGKYHADGKIEFSGRMDQQVKIRGFRIELGEIESALLKHPQVADAAVFVHHDELLGAALVAFVQPKQNESIDPAQLLAFERERLPAYMVASQLFVLERFPLTPSGKVDRKAMAASIERPKTEDAILQAPRDDVERELVEIWEQCFERTPISIDEDFFALGGHSLLALRLFSEIEKRMGKAMMLSLLFQAPTVRQLANVIRD